MRRFAPITIGLILALVCPLGRAQTETPPDPSSLSPEERKIVADRYFERAQKQLDEEDWDQACANFRVSMRYDTSVSTLANIARCEEHDGRLFEAWAANNRARFLNRNTADQQRRTSLNQYLTKAIAKLEAQLPSIRVVIPSSPADLVIKSDGAPMPASGAGEPFPVNPGRHELEVSAPGFRTATRSIEVKPGERMELVIPLEKGEDPVEAPPPSPPPNFPAPVVAPGADERRAEGDPPIWVWPVGAVGLAALGGAIGLGVDSASARNDLRDGCTEGADGVFECPDDRFDRSTVDTLKRRSNLGLGLGVGLGVVAAGTITAAIIGLATGRDPDTTHGALELQLDLGCEGGTGGVRWRF